MARKRMTKKNLQNLHRIIFAFFVGCFVGYMTHYFVVNWKNFFLTCIDGSRPDENGCCVGEVYTDTGDGIMACCQSDGEKCLPPIK